MLQAQKALATGNFSNQLGVWGCCSLPQYKQGCAVQYKAGKSIFSNKHVQYEQGTLSSFGGTGESYF